MNVALEWIRSTFLYIRVLQNPAFYGKSYTIKFTNIIKYIYSGYSKSITKSEAENLLLDLCVRNVSALTSEGFVKEVTSYSKPLLLATDVGKLCAKYCISFKSMNKFTTANSNLTLNELVQNYIYF